MVFKPCDFAFPSNGVKAEVIPILKYDTTVGHKR